jgi:hypothetical protein
MAVPPQATQHIQARLAWQQLIEHEEVGLAGLQSIME